LQEKGTPGANHGPREVSVHSEEQHTGSETPGLIVLIMTITYISKVATLQVGIVAVTTILKCFDSRDVLMNLP
jgi:hypothetical protein